MTISWTMTAGQLADNSARRVQMLGSGQQLSGHRWNEWLGHANGFLKLLQTQGPNEWRRAEQTVDLVAGTASYVLNPRPYKVHDIIQLRDASGRDMPVQRWNQDTYRMIPYKASQGMPACFVVNRQVASTTLTLWPVPNTLIAASSLIVPYDRVIEDVTSRDTAMDLPQEWMDGVTDILGVRLAGSFNLQNAAVAAAKERASVAINELLGEDHDHSITFVFDD